MEILVSTFHELFPIVPECDSIHETQEETNGRYKNRRYENTHIDFQVKLKQTPNGRSGAKNSEKKFPTPSRSTCDSLQNPLQNADYFQTSHLEFRKNPEIQKSETTMTKGWCFMHTKFYFSLTPNILMRCSRILWTLLISTLNRHYPI